MAEALTIFAVIWAWALLLLGFGAFVEWLGGVRGRRESAEPSDDQSEPTP